MKNETKKTDGFLTTDDIRSLAAILAMAGLLAEGKTTLSALPAKAVQLADQLLETL